MRQSIKLEGLERHIDKQGDLFGGRHFRAAVERGVNIANLQRLFGQPGKPKARETIEKWLEHLHSEDLTD